MNLITTTEAAKRLKITPQRVRVLIAEGRLQATKVNDRLQLIDPRDLAKVRNRKPGRPMKGKR